jgi:hypothetical protein
MEGIFFFEFLRRCGTILTADSLDLRTLLFSWCSCGGTSHIAPPDMPRAWSTEPSVDCPLKFTGADITNVLQSRLVKLQ